MVKNTITVPFVYSDPQVGRVVFPIKGYIWTIYLVLLTLIMAGMVHSFFKANESSEGISFLLINMAIGFGFIAMIVNYFLDKYIFDHIVIEDNQLIIKHSRVLSGKENVYQIGPDSKMAWSINKLKINYIEVSYNQLIFYDIENKENILIKKFIISQYQERSWIKFMNNLDEIASFEIVKEEIR